MSGASSVSRSSRLTKLRVTPFSAISYLIAARIAARIGLINTMVFTHLPANVCLMIGLSNLKSGISKLGRGQAYGLCQLM